MPDFSGRWLLAAEEGDFDEYMKARGAGYVSRSMARAMGYGVRRLEQSVQQEGSSFRVSIRSPKGVKEVELQVNGEEQEGLDPVDDKPVQLRACWEGQTLLITSRRAVAVGCRSVWVQVGDERPGQSVALLPRGGLGALRSPLKALKELRRGRGA